MKKVILLVDMNAFFISCETARNPELKGKPATVAGDPKNRSGIILTANYEARKFGVKTTMLLHDAKKLCPNIIFVPPDHIYYEEMSQKVMAILNRFSPVVQQNSIDEAWMDLTGCEKLYGQPLKIAQSIMDSIKNELGLWCSIGISENKFLSKMASEMKKPLGITEVWQKDIKEKIWPLPVRSMYGIGKQTENKLSQLAIYTIGDIAKSDISLLMKVFGKYGSELHSLANGVDISKVEPNPKADNKSISRSTTLSEDIRDLDSAETILLRLSEEVGEEARKIGCKGSTITVTIKYNDFSSITRQKTIKPTYLTTDIYNAGISLLKQNWHNREVRLLGIGLSNFLDNYIEQMTFIDEHSYINTVKKEENLEKALDIIRNKYGKDKIKRAKLMEEKIKKRT